MAGNDRWKYISVVLVILLLGVLAYMYMGGDRATPDRVSPGNSTSLEDYASANESTGSTPADTVASADAQVEILRYGVSPSRVETDIGAVVEWRNTNDFPVRLEFDRTPQEPVIEPGETFQMRFDGITYYGVYNTETGREFASGSVYVE